MISFPRLRYGVDSSLIYTLTISFVFCTFLHGRDGFPYGRLHSKQAFGNGYPLVIMPCAFGIRDRYVLVR